MNSLLILTTGIQPSESKDSEDKYILTEVKIYLCTTRDFRIRRLKNLERNIEDHQQ